MIATTAAANPVAVQEFSADDHPSTVTEVITPSAHFKNYYREYISPMPPPGPFSSSKSKPF